MDMNLSKHVIGDEQGGLACCCPRRHIESDTTEQLNWTELILILKDAAWNFLK